MSSSQLDAQPGTTPDEVGNTFPLPSGLKHPPPVGVTGANGTPYTGDWPEDCNVGLRLAPHVIGLDVDGEEHAPGKVGPQTIARLEAELGQLPATAYSTRHGAGSETRVMLFEVPSGYKFRESGLDDVEVIQSHHRYLVVAPSTLEDGTAYGWYGSDDRPIGFPSRWDIEALPEAWLYRLFTESTPTGSAFQGSPAAWLESLGDYEPDDRVLSVIERMRDDSPREDMLKRQRELIGLGAEGHLGVRAALDVLHGLWTSRAHVSGDPDEEWGRALLDGIAKFGGTTAEPDKTTAVRVAKEVTDEKLSKMFFEPVGADDRRKFIRGLLALGYTPQEVFETAWHLPMRGDLTDKRLNQEIHDLANPEPQAKLEAGGTVSLLTSEEREHLKTVYSFVDHYCHAVSILQTPWNMSYHRLNAWALLALTFSDLSWVRVGKGLNLNLYCFQIGPSGSGKSEAMLDMHGFLRAINRFDAINIDDNATEVGLVKALSDRIGEVVWFQGDEAERLLLKMKPDSRGQVVWGALQATLTQLYDTGYVTKVLRSDNALESRDQGGHVYFNLWEDGTPDDIFSNLTVSQVKKGFVARFITAFGEKPVRTREDLRTRRQERSQNRHVRDPYVAELAQEMQEVREFVAAHVRHGLTPTDEAIARMDDAREKALTMFEGDPLWDMIEPNVLRISYVMWKAAGLNAISQGRETITVDDVLVALQATEEWLANSIRLMRGIRSSDFSAQVESVFNEIAKTGSVSASTLYRRMFNGHGMPQRMLDEMTQNLSAQGRVKLERGVWKVQSDG